MRRVIDQVQQIWEAKYKDLSVPDESRSQDSQNRTQRKKGKQKKNDNIESIFDGIRNELAGLKLGAEDDFLPFDGAPPVELHNLTPVQWWGLDGQRSQYPRLHRMALDILCSTNVRCAGENIFRWRKDNFMDKGKAQAQKRWDGGNDGKLDFKRSNTTWYGHEKTSGRVQAADFFQLICIYLAAPEQSIGWVIAWAIKNIT